MPRRPAGYGAGMPVLGAERLVRQPPPEVYAFLAELRNHWRLDDRLLRLAHLDPDGDGGRIVIRGPLGVRRTARIRLTDLAPPGSVTGEAAVGRRTRARVRWTIAPHARGSRVGVEAMVLNAAPLDRLLLAGGGAAWMRRRLRAALTRAANALDAPAASASAASERAPAPSRASA